MRRLLLIPSMLLGIGATIIHHFAFSQKPNRNNVYFYYTGDQKLNGSITLVANWTIIDTIPMCMGTTIPCFVITNSSYPPHLYTKTDLVNYIKANHGFGYLSVVKKDSEGSD